MHKYFCLWYEQLPGKTRLCHIREQQRHRSVFKSLPTQRFLLAHLSRRLIWWAYRIGTPPSYVVHTLLNIFSLETIRPVKVKFHMELLWDWGTKVCSNGHGHMTKLAAMPIYGKNLKKPSSVEPKGRWPWNLVCIIGCLITIKFAQMMALEWPWHILQEYQIWSLVLLYGTKVKQWIFPKLLSSTVLFLGRSIAPFTYVQVWWPSKVKEVCHVGRTCKNR